jgi:sulfite reductase alpha subunit-like flavoprotein
MENNGLSTGDLALMREGNGFGDNGFAWIFGLLILMGMMNGGGLGWGNNAAAALGYQNLATQNDVQRGFDTAALQDQSRDILSAVNAGTAQAVAATNAAQNLLSSQISDVRMMEQNILGQQAECCSSIKQMITESKYEQAMALAAFEQRLNSKLDQSEITALRDQVQKLQLDQATNGMLKFPNAWTYGAGPFPPIFMPPQTSSGTTTG